MQTIHSSRIGGVWDFAAVRALVESGQEPEAVVAMQMA